MTREIGIGLIGYGGIGRVHALCYRMLPLCYPNLALRPRLVAVQVASERGMARASDELGQVHVTTDLDALLGDDTIQLIDCCAPTGDHGAIVRAALEAGKHVFCEKPLATTGNEAAELAALAYSKNLIHGVNYHFRAIPALQAAKRWIDEGNLGDVVSFHMRYARASNLKRDRPVNWRFVGAGSGVLVDLGAHLVDMTLHLLGPIARVGAQTQTVVTERPDAQGANALVESDDAAWLSLELANGARGTAHASKVVPGAADDLRIEAYGTRGALVFDTADPNNVQLADAQGQRRMPTLSAAMPQATYPSSELVTAPIMWHLTSVAAFLQALAAQTGSSPDFAAAARVDAVLETAALSASQNGTPLEIKSFV